MRKCSLCSQTKDEKYFYPREDAFNLYSWCIRCMNEQGRSPEYPPEKERGSGVYRVNYNSLKVGYVIPSS
jgi:hypothetical protein